MGPQPLLARRAAPHRQLLQPLLRLLPTPEDASLRAHSCLERAVGVDLCRAVLGWSGDGWQSALGREDLGECGCLGDSGLWDILFDCV